MKVITRRQYVADRVRNWIEGYGQLGSYNRSLAQKLLPLGPTPHPDLVDAALGNNQWTRFQCAECDQQSEALVQLGEPPDYESATACICRSCLLAAVSLLDDDDE